MIEYLIGDATEAAQQLPESEVIMIVHVVNNIGAWGKGFVTGLNRRYPSLKPKYRRAIRDGKLELGEVQLLKVTELEPCRVLVANLCAQKGLKGYQNPHPLDYHELEVCLHKLDYFISQAKVGPIEVHMPRIGCGLAGGDWKRVADIIERRLVSAPVFVFDLLP